MTVADILRGLGSLTETRQAMVTALGRQYGRAVVLHVIETLGTADPAGSLPARDDFTAAIAQAGHRCWSADISYANELVRRGTQSAPLAAAQLVLGFAGLGLEGSFTFDLPYPDRLLLGHNRPRCSGRVRIRAGRGAVAIDGEDEAYRYALADGIWHQEGPTERLVRRSAEAEMVFAAGYCVDPEILLGEDSSLDATSFDRACASLDGALAIVRQAGEPVRQWVGGMVSIVSMVASENGTRLSSRSLPNRAGNIEMAVPGDEMHLAELFVHEAAHQYFHLGALLGPYVTPAARGKSFLSALNGRQRPLDRIALAYHAVGNIFIFLDRLVRGGSSQAAPARHRLIELGPIAASLRETLLRNDSLLTSAGINILDALFRETDGICADHRLSSRPAAHAVRGVN